VTGDRDLQIGPLINRARLKKYFQAALGILAGVLFFCGGFAWAWLSPEEPVWKRLVVVALGFLVGLGAGIALVKMVGL